METSGRLPHQAVRRLFLRMKREEKMLVGGEHAGATPFELQGNDRTCGKVTSG